MSKPGRMSGLWALLFGPFFWVYWGIWRHAILSLLVWPLGTFALLSPAVLLSSGKWTADGVEQGLRYAPLMLATGVGALMYVINARKIIRREEARRARS